MFRSRGKKKSVRPWVSPLMHIIRVFLETSKRFLLSLVLFKQRVFIYAVLRGRVSGRDQQLTWVRDAHLTLCQRFACRALVSEALLVRCPVLTPGNAFGSGTRWG